MSVHFTRPETTIMIDLDDCIWDLVDNWIDKYNSLGLQETLDIRQVVAWDIEKCLGITNPNEFWGILDNEEFWQNVTVDNDVKQALQELNSFEDIDLIICTDTYYKSATVKLKRFFELLPFIEPSQVICCKEKWRVDCDVIIDDKPETLEHFLYKMDDPPLVCKVERPWNKSVFVWKTFNKLDINAINYILNFTDSAKALQGLKGGTK